MTNNKTGESMALFHHPSSINIIQSKSWSIPVSLLGLVKFFFFNDTATTEIYTLSYTTLFRSRAPHPAASRKAAPASGDPHHGHDAVGGRARSEAGRGAASVGDGHHAYQWRPRRRYRLAGDGGPFEPGKEGNRAALQGSRGSCRTQASHGGTQDETRSA